MKVGVLCEFSGIVRDAFLKRGHDAISCDLLGTESPGPHIKGDLFDQDWSGFDLLIMHPTCTYLCVSGLHWNKRRPERAEKTEDALLFVQRMMEIQVSRYALENPIGCISTRIRKPDQVVQPWWFGDDASKATCLWLKNLPLLKPTNEIHHPAWIPCECCDDYWCVLHRKHVLECRCQDIDSWTRRGLWPYAQGGYYANQTPSGQNKLGPSATRWMDRSRTYQGLAEAMADQWGSLLRSAEHG